MWVTQSEWNEWSEWSERVERMEGVGWVGTEEVVAERVTRSIIWFLVHSHHTGATWGGLRSAGVASYNRCHTEEVCTQWGQRSEVSPPGAHSLFPLFISLCRPAAGRSEEECTERPPLAATPGRHEMKRWRGWGSPFYVALRSLCTHTSLAHCRAVGSPHSVLSPLTMGPEGRGGAPGVSPQGGWKAGRILGLVTSLSNSRFLTSSLTSDTVASDIILFYVNGFPLGLLTFKIPLFTSILLPPIMSHERAVGDVSGEDGRAAQDSSIKRSIIRAARAVDSSFAPFTSLERHFVARDGRIEWRIKWFLNHLRI